MIIKKSKSDKIFDVVNVSFCTIILLIVLYPLLYVLSASFSDPLAVLQGKMKLFPIGFNIDAYIRIFHYKEVLIGYKNSLILMVVGTSINVVLTILGAYPLSRYDFYGRNGITMMLAFTMFFTGGMIPTYLVVQKLGLIDTMWSMIFPTAIAMYNLIIMRTFFQSTIPEEMIEASYIDGASNIQVLFRIIIPLSKSVIAVICLFYGVQHWNQYFQAMLYVTSKEKYPLQMILREILLLSQVQDLVDTEGFEQQLLQGESIKYSLIIIASVPVLCIYPFVQKYFVKGVMIGAIKG